MSNLSNEERETHLNLLAVDRTVWSIASNDSVMIARIEKAGHQPVRTVGETRFYEVPYAAVLIRKGKKELSEESRRRLAERLRASSTVEDFESQTD